MIQLSQGAGEVVTGDLRDAIEAYDNAILSSTRMNASTMEAMMGAGVPVGQSQRLLAALVASIRSVVDGRGELVEATRHMLAIKDASTIAAYDFGCPTGIDGDAPVKAVQAQPVERV